MISKIPNYRGQQNVFIKAIKEQLNSTIFPQIKTFIHVMDGK
jgi:hypothetical protein